jgi:hypothetical protein
MIVNFKFFYEKTDKNYDEYNKLWNENIERIIFLPHDLPLSKQRSSIINNITDNTDILAIRFCSHRTITHNIIVNNIMLGRGFNYDDNKIWYPKEVWIYNLKTVFEM